MADVSSYSDINAWWRGEGVCSNAGWRLEREMKEERRKQEERRKEEEEKRKEEKEINPPVNSTSDNQSLQGSERR